MPAQAEANRLVRDAHACVLRRQYADAAEKFHGAAQRMGSISDAVHAEYLTHLASDAGEKRRIADAAHGKMRQGQALLEKRQDFERWEDVVDVGLPAFADAELLYTDAGDLFASLDEHDNSQRAQARAVESAERKIHAEELRDSPVIVVQPSGDFAPQRRDAARRTMGYASAMLAAGDVATRGVTSTYHAVSEILEDSTVYLRKGVHEFTETIDVVRSVRFCAEAGVVADDCVMVIMQRHIRCSLCVCVCVCVCV